MNSVGLADVLIRNVGADLRAINENDFKGEDGLMHCGTCREPIQKIVNIPLPGYGDRIVRAACACERAQMEQEERELKIRMEKEEVSRLRNLSLMDVKVRDSTFDKYQATADNAYALKVCQRYVSAFDTMMERNQGLLFYGNPGTGKTFAAACIANSLLENLHSVVMTSFVKLIADLHGEDDEEGTIQRINRCDLLIIDDLGAERSTDYALERVYNIVDSRYRARKPMLLTTNLSLKEMQATNDIRYARIYDRIFEVCFPLEFKGKSWRYKEAASRYDSMKALLEG